ncbi:hypothetical protein JG687_00015772 [Phytophthora cactorum]|uniref:Uncharacterized protein n=1 Tax=Phytophthora cactorum TaxID=29920 RepID=A0A8T1TU17_9STRA|nr:hypothetical protein GQ600_24531 [Phytophthora cactorum]KAG6947971.1 hypothetical protein JG687_00015772 [Phytophthora cactorum]
MLNKIPSAFRLSAWLLSEYLEAFVPVLYAIYTVAMVHLPSAKYHTELSGITADNVGGEIQTILDYALLELLSIALASMIHRGCVVRSLHHLAFVLETHMSLIRES